jgi:hypothetical protein
MGGISSMVDHFIISGHLYLLPYSKLMMEAALEQAEKMSGPCSKDVLDPGLGKNG